MLHAIAPALFIVSILGTPAVAYALSCAPRHFTLNEAYEAADSIIVGLVTTCEEERSSDPWTSGGADCSFVSLEALKESVPARDYGGVASSAACGLSLQVGNKYVLFLDSGNQPLHFGASLSIDQHDNPIAQAHVRIIRDFRDGRVQDLAEPWFFGEFEGHCSISHGIARNQIVFSRSSPNAQPQPKPTWTQETIGGEIAYRSSVPANDAGSNTLSGPAELVAYGDFPEDPNDALMLNVSLVEGFRAPVRQATIRVGQMTWSLNRMEMKVPLQGAIAHTSIFFYESGEVAEQILSAMIRPSDIVVSAIVLAPTTASAPPSPDQISSAPGRSADAFFGQAPPDSSSTGPSAMPNEGAVKSQGAQEEPADPVIRVESRSTQLSSVIQDFRACYAGNEE